MDAPTKAPNDSPTDFPTRAPNVIQDSANCGAISESGGKVIVETYTVDLKGNSGWIDIWYYMHTNPDGMEVFYDGQLIRHKQIGFRQENNSLIHQW